MFEAKHGTGYQGDIAIDDIVAKPGRCGDPGKLNFQVLCKGVFFDLYIV